MYRSSCAELNPTLYISSVLHTPLAACDSIADKITSLSLLFPLACINKRSSNITNFDVVPTFYLFPIEMQTQDFNQYMKEPRLNRLTSHQNEIGVI